MKLGILGTGMIVQDFMNTIEDLNLEKVSILGTEKYKNQAEAMIKDHNLGGQVFLDYDELLKSDVDTIYVALPNFLHYSFSKKALEAGKNVICEKPITSNIKELEDLKRIAKENEKVIVEAMTIHYMPGFLKLKEDVKNVGAVKIVSLNYSQYSSRYDAFKEGTILPAFDYHKSGGALYDINVYNIHFVVDLFGKPEKVSYLPNVEKGIDTSGILTLDYGSFKAVLVGAKDCAAPLMNTIQGDEANIIVRTPVSRMTTYSYGKNKQEAEVKDYNEDKHAMFYEFTAFKDMIDNKDFDRADAMMEISTIASDIMTQARKDGGIVFDADK